MCAYMYVYKGNRPMGIRLVFDAVRWQVASADRWPIAWKQWRWHNPEWYVGYGFFTISCRSR